MGLKAYAVIARHYDEFRIVGTYNRECVAEETIENVETDGHLEIRELDISNEPDDCSVVFQRLGK